MCTRRRLRVGGTARNTQTHAHAHTHNALNNMSLPAARVRDPSTSADASSARAPLRPTGMFDGVLYIYSCELLVRRMEAVAAEVAAAEAAAAATAATV